MDAKDPNDVAFEKKESLLEVTQIAIDAGHVDVVQRQFNKLLYQVVDLSSKIIDLTSSALNETGTEPEHHVDTLVGLQKVEKQRSTSSRRNSASSVASSARKASMWRVSTRQGTPVSTTSRSQREKSQPMINNGTSPDADNDSRRPVLRRASYGVARGSFSRGEQQNILGDGCKRRSVPQQILRRYPCTNGEPAAAARGTFLRDQLPSALDGGGCAVVRHVGPAPFIEEELSEEQVKATMLRLRETQPRPQPYCGLLHVHSCPRSLNLLQGSRVGGECTKSTRTQLELSQGNNTEQPQPDCSLCFATPLFLPESYANKIFWHSSASKYHDKSNNSGELKGRPLCKPKPTCLSEESFGCTSAYFQSSFSTEQQNHAPLSNAASGEETAFEVFNSPQTSNSEEICSTDEVASVNACDVVVWHPLETPELILNQPLPAARLKAKTAEAVAAGGGRDFGSSNVVVAHCSTATYSLFIIPPSYSLPSLPLLPPTTSETDLTLEVAQKTTEVATKCLTVPSVT